MSDETKVKPAVTETRAAWIDMPEPKPNMTEDYNPQKRTFIEKPKVKLCPTCGQPVALPAKQMKGCMSVYVNAETGRDYAAIADDAETLVVQGVSLTRKDKWKGNKQ